MIKDAQRPEVEPTEPCIFAQLLGKTLRPGGLVITAKAAAIAGICSHHMVLDIGCGEGTTVAFLAQQYACRITGIDLSEKMIFSSHLKVEEKTLTDKINLMVGDGERLPFGNASFNVVIIESAFSLFPNQKNAAEEIIRVLKPGGKLALSDVTLRGRVSEELQSQITFPCCMAGAKRLEEYVRLFEEAGFRLYYLEDRSSELQQIGFQLGMAFGGLDNIPNKLPSGPCQRKRKEVSMNIAGAWPEFLRLGRPGYVLMTMTKK